VKRTENSSVCEREKYRERVPVKVLERLEVRRQARGRKHHVYKYRDVCCLQRKRKEGVGESLSDKNRQYTNHSE